MTTRREFLTAATVTTLASVTAPNALLAADPPVRLGFSIAKTGMFASAAQSQVDTYNFWKDQVNAAGGLDVATTKAIPPRRPKSTKNSSLRTKSTSCSPHGAHRCISASRRWSSALSSR
jgi:hypothetical protein